MWRERLWTVDHLQHINPGCTCLPVVLHSYIVHKFNQCMWTVLRKHCHVAQGLIKKCSNIVYHFGRLWILFGILYSILRCDTALDIIPCMKTLNFSTMFCSIMSDQHRLLSISDILDTNIDQGRSDRNRYLSLPCPPPLPPPKRKRNKKRPYLHVICSLADFSNTTRKVLFCDYR